MPAFSTRERLITHLRTPVNSTIFARMRARLTPDEQTMYQGLLAVKDHSSGFQARKELPKSASVGHLKELQTWLNWLGQLGDTERLLEGMPLTKIKHCAAEAAGQDAATMQDFERPPR